MPTLSLSENGGKGFFEFDADFYFTAGNTVSGQFTPYNIPDRLVIQDETGIVYVDTGVISGTNLPIAFTLAPQSTGKLHITVDAPQSGTVWNFSLTANSDADGPYSGPLDEVKAKILQAIDAKFNDPAAVFDLELNLIKDILEYSAELQDDAKLIQKYIDISKMYDVASKLLSQGLYTIELGKGFIASMEAKSSAPYLDAYGHATAGFIAGTAVIALAPVAVPGLVIAVTAATFGALAGLLWDEIASPHLKDADIGEALLDVTTAIANSYDKTILKIDDIGDRVANGFSPIIDYIDEALDFELNLPSIRLQTAAGEVAAVPINLDALLDDVVSAFDAHLAKAVIGTAAANTISATRGVAYGQGGNDTIKASTGPAFLAGGTGDDKITGSAGNDRIFGDAGNDNLTGGAGNDLMVGGVGDDVIMGGDGIDALQGGLGNDRLDGGSQKDQLVGEDGDDVLIGGLDKDLLIGGIGSDTLNGGAGDDALVGGDGNDVLAGGEGKDQMVGGAGTDRFIGTARELNSDTIQDFSLGDTIFVADRKFTTAAVTYNATAHTLSIDTDGNGSKDLTINLTASLSGITAKIVGNSTEITVAATPSGPTSGDDVLNGTAGPDSIDALAGNDTVDGLAGNDQLIGNSGNDRLNGGDGDDKLIGNVGNDVLIGGAGYDEATWYRDGGTGGVTVDLATGTAIRGAERDTLSGIERVGGSDFADTLNGDALANYLGGGNGSDIINGRDGNDTLVGGLGSDTMDGGAGIDAVSYELSGTTAVLIDLSTNIGRHGTDIDRFLNIENVIGTDFADTLNGNVGANDLRGGVGNDAINGLGGIDNLLGGAGNDTIHGNDGDDLIYGGTEDDLLYGDGGADQIGPGYGVDVMSGGAGNDRFDINPLDSGVGRGARDIISDFARGDRIDIVSIDAKENAASDQAFTFIGTKAFNAPGQLRFFQEGSVTVIEGSTDTDTAPEFQIEISKLFIPIAADFIL